MDSNLVIDIKQYPGAVMYAKLHHVSLKQLVDGFLMKFQTPAVKKTKEVLELPPHLEKLGGCLTGVEDLEDEKLNYLLEKYK